MIQGHFPGNIKQKVAITKDIRQNIKEKALWSKIFETGLVKSLEIKSNQNETHNINNNLRHHQYGGEGAALHQ